MRFTIRDLLWLTVVVAFAVLWWGEYRQRMSDSAELRGRFKPLERERDDLVSKLLSRDGRERLMLMPPGMRTDRGRQIGVLWHARELELSHGRESLRIAGRRLLAHQGADLAYLAFARDHRGHCGHWRSEHRHDRDNEFAGNRSSL